MSKKCEKRPSAFLTIPCDVFNLFVCPKPKIYSVKQDIKQRKAGNLPL